jgi:hypothetical protein
MSTSDRDSGEGRASIAERLARLDRRWLFLLIALAVTVPILRPLHLPVTPGPRTEAVFAYIEQLEPGSVVLVSFDFGPSSMPELRPMAVAVLRHCFQRDLRVLVMTLYTDGAALAEGVVEEVAEEADKVAGRDYINLGFKPGWTSVVLGMGADIVEVFPKDYGGNGTAAQPVMEGVRNFADIDLVIPLSSSAAPVMWITYAGARFGATMAAGVTAVMIVDFYPYLQTDQLIGLIGGLKGAADYEKLLAREADGVRGMDSQSITHIVIVVFVILGNIGYLALRRARRRR